MKKNNNIVNNLPSFGILESIILTFEWNLSAMPFSSHFKCKQMYHLRSIEFDHKNLSHCFLQILELKKTWNKKWNIFMLLVFTRTLDS